MWQRLGPADPHDLRARPSRRPSRRVLPSPACGCNSVFSSCAFSHVSAQPVGVDPGLGPRHIHRTGSAHDPHTHPIPSSAALCSLTPCHTDRPSLHALALFSRKCGTHHGPQLFWAARSSSPGRTSRTTPSCGRRRRTTSPAGRPGMDGFWSRELLGSWGTEDNLFTAFALVVAFGASLTPAADVFPVAFPAVQSGRS